MYNHIMNKKERTLIQSKHPLQIYLDDRQNQFLRRLARERNASISELVREGIDLLLAKLPAEEDPAYHLIGLGATKTRYVADQHDEYIVNEIEKESDQ
jgi:hypothetical protein